MPNPNPAPTDTEMLDWLIFYSGTVITSMDGEDAWVEWYAAPGSRKSPRFGKRLANRPIAHIGRSPDVHDQLVLRSLLYFV